MRFSFLQNRKWLAYVIAFPILGLISIFGQQCAKVNLEKIQETVFASSNRNPFLLDPPTDYPIYRRFILVVDMSNSMISGKCPQDVDAGILFSAMPTTPYDPNKHVGNKNDHSTSGIDCKVSETLEIKKQDSPVLSLGGASLPDIYANPPTVYLTHLGNDFEGNRFKMIEQWIANVRTQTTATQLPYVSFMIVPLTGGNNQTKLHKKVTEATLMKSVFEFLEVTDLRLDTILNVIKEEQRTNLLLAESDDVYRYETTLMGTTAIGDILYPIYDAITRDMQKLNEAGNLNSAEYLFTHVGDGYVTPKLKMFQDVLGRNNLCDACKGALNTCSGVCSQLVGKMEDAWGKSTSNDLKMIEFNYGLIQGLPSYYGAGNVRIDFVRLQKERAKAGNEPGAKTYFEELLPIFATKNRKATIWDSNDAKPPFRFPGTAENAMSFKLTHLFVLNLNARLNALGEIEADSDGDGVPDSQEIALGLDPTNPRTHGVCIDSMYINPSYHDRCVAMEAARSCDVTLDSDGDSLNECEESLLGTDPFDFDTDGDGIPDFLEVIYGYNPLFSDAEKDSNGDGIPNLVNFSSGLGPAMNLLKIPEHLRSSYEVNYKGKGEVEDRIFGHLYVELYQLIVKYLPTVATLPVDTSKLGLMYSSRQSANNPDRSKNIIPYDRQLFAVSTKSGTNTLLALARMVDKDDSTRAYWRIYKTEVLVHQPITQGQIDLSKFVLIKAMDRGQ